ncbi:ferritin-3, chloroplastic-like [Rhodamnia argentea]|uniref:Ferritin n=1 Tax=Rhodamnia argentea TaxID=178133 RepID=A0A8B8PHR0_9MYRT|nr:ferritin-3, chloroplastic-like [Rhodamnia argentea]
MHVSSFFSLRHSLSLPLFDSSLFLVPQIHHLSLSASISIVFFRDNLQSAFVLDPMSLKASQVLSLLNGDSHALFPLLSPVSSPFSPCSTMPSTVHFSRGRNEQFRVVCASKGANNRQLSGVVFEPFEEVKKELALVPTSPHLSLARQKYSDQCESAVNVQINVEYNVSYVYHAMYAYFDRDNVALKGLAKFFKDSSEEEREHAEILMEYQNKRGGKVQLRSIVMPFSEFNHEDKGEALYAMELALSLEKLTNEKLLNLQKVAEQNHDVQLMDFVDSRFLAEQVASIKKISEYVAQLRRVGKGHGVWHFDQMLLHEEAVA